MLLGCRILRPADLFGHEKESLFHFAFECQHLPPDLQRPYTPLYLGPNFALLGVVEMPMSQVRDRLRVSRTTDIAVHAWTDDDVALVHLWKDGSVDGTQQPWTAIASYACIHEDGSVFQVGRVFHWRLSSFTAELWAIIVAFAASDSPVIIHTDSLSVVQVFQQLIDREHVDPAWAHADWWGFLLQLILLRRSSCNVPLRLLWCPAHKLEHLQPQEISEGLQQHATTKQDIVLNRIADQTAKDFLREEAAALLLASAQQKEAVYKQQRWLALLNRLCKPPPVVSGTAEVVQEDFALAPRLLCPAWPWDADKASFPWKADLAGDTVLRTRRGISDKNFRSFLTFCNSLCWQIQEGTACSIFELATLAYFVNFRFDLESQTVATPFAYVKVLRDRFAVCKAEGLSAAPVFLESKN